MVSSVALSGFFFGAGCVWIYDQWEFIADRWALLPKLNAKRRLRSAPGTVLNIFRRRSHELEDQT